MSFSGTKATAVTRSSNVTSGTATTLAISMFRNQVEQRRTRLRNSEGSLPRSLGNAMFSMKSQSGSMANVLGGAGGVGIDAQAPSHQRPPLLFVQSVINNSPGSYIGDDGSPDIQDRYNFYAHGRRYLFATNSLWYFDETSIWRRRIIWLITSKSFDQFVLALIFANSIVLALPDLSKVDPASGDLDTSDSLRNAIVGYTDVIFTTIFSIEFTLKIIAMGLVAETGAYLMDPWNWIDFVVVLVGIIAVIPGVPNVSGLRALRVLRPLRFLNAVPGIKKLVTALLRSIPELLSVVAFLFFLFFLYCRLFVFVWLFVRLFVHLLAGVFIRLHGTRSRIYEKEWQYRCALLGMKE